MLLYSLGQDILSGFEFKIFFFRHRHSLFSLSGDILSGSFGCQIQTASSIRRLSRVSVVLKILNLALSLSMSLFHTIVGQHTIELDRMRLLAHKS